MDQKQLSWMQKQQSQNALLSPRKQSSSSSLPWVVSASQGAEEQTKVSSDYLRQIYMTSFRSSHFPSSPIPSSPTLPRRVLHTKPQIQENQSPKEHGRAMSQPVAHPQFQTRMVSSSQETNQRSASVALDQNVGKRNIQMMKPTALLSILEYGDGEEEEEKSTTSSEIGTTPSLKSNLMTNRQPPVDQYTTSMAHLSPQYGILAPYYSTRDNDNVQVLVFEEIQNKNHETKKRLATDSQQVKQNEQPRSMDLKPMTCNTKEPQLTPNQPMAGIYIEAQQNGIPEETTRPASKHSNHVANSTQSKDMHSNILNDSPISSTEYHVCRGQGHIFDSKKLPDSINSDPLASQEEYHNQDESTIIGDSLPDMQDKADWMDVAKELPSSGDVGDEWVRHTLDDLNSIITPPSQFNRDEKHSSTTNSTDGSPFIYHPTPQHIESGSSTGNLLIENPDLSHIEPKTDINPESLIDTQHKESQHSLVVNEEISQQSDPIGHIKDESHLGLTLGFTQANDITSVPTDKDGMSSNSVLEYDYSNSITKPDVILPSQLTIEKTSKLPENSIFPNNLLCTLLYEKFEKEDIQTEDCPRVSCVGESFIIDQPDIQSLNEVPQETVSQSSTSHQSETISSDGIQPKNITNYTDEGEAEFTVSEDTLSHQLASLNSSNPGVDQSDSHTPEVAVVPMQENESATNLIRKQGTLLPSCLGDSVDEQNPSPTHNPDVPDDTSFAREVTQGYQHSPNIAIQVSNTDHDSELGASDAKRQKRERSPSKESTTAQKDNQHNIKRIRQEAEVLESQDRLCPLTATDTPNHRYEDAAVQTGISQKEKDAIRVQMLDWIKRQRIPISLNQIRMEADNQLPDLEPWLEDLVAAGILKCKSLHQSKQTQVTLYQYQGNPRPLKSALSTPKKEGKAGPAKEVTFRTPPKQPPIHANALKINNTTPTEEDLVLINHLHIYNETKDVGQMLIGQMALLRGLRTMELYPEYGLELED